MEPVAKIQRIEDDFTQQNEPFDEVEFPEARLLREVAVMVGSSDEPVSLSMEDKLRLVSAFATFDYNRDANQLVDKLLTLQANHSELYDAWSVGSAKELKEPFDRIGFRYPSRDAKAWATNCEILRNKYHGRWHELLLETGLNAESLVERLNGDDFHVMKGAKVAPMYARIVSNEVAELDRLWELDIPIDTHIRRLSKDLFDMPEADDDELRDTWYFYAIQNDIDRHIVDGSLWHIGNKWDDWGEDYWESL